MRNISSNIRLVLITFIVAGFLGLSADWANAQSECTLEITKVAIPANNQPFDFDVTGDATTSFTLTDPSSPTTGFGINLDESFTFTELVPSGWDLVSIECDDAPDNCGDTPCLNIIIDESTNSLTAECLDNNPVRECTFTNALSATNVPTLSTWGIAALAAVIGILAFVVLRRRQQAA